MSFYIVNNEYDMDKTIKECMKLINLKNSKVQIAFNNMGMVNIFMLNLGEVCDQYDIDPEEHEFHIDVLVNAPILDDEDEELI